MKRYVHQILQTTDFASMSKNRNKKTTDKFMSTFNDADDVMIANLRKHKNIHFKTNDYYKTWRVGRIKET